MGEVQNRHRENLFPHEDSHTLAEVAQRSCAVHTFGAFSKPAWSSLDCPVILQRQELPFACQNAAGALGQDYSPCTYGYTGNINTIPRRFDL